MRSTAIYFITNQLNVKLNKQGFTLVEVAIVLVIVGLLMGGVLKGSELINGAKVSSLNNKLSSFKTAWYAFNDRYQAYPGDFNTARSAIDSGLTDGNGNGIVENTREMGQVWVHLSKAGFIKGSFAGTPAASNERATPPTGPANGFGKAMMIGWDNRYQPQPGRRHNLNTGTGIAGKILGELDRKTDDGKANSGEMALNYNGRTRNCAVVADWNLKDSSNTCWAVLRLD